MQISRRNFLKGSALGMAGMAGASALGLAACAPNQTAAESKNGTGATGGSNAGLFDSGIETQLSLTSADYDVDVVIVGGGAAGMAACATAAEEGLNVLLVEANSAVGGNTQFAEGIAGINTEIQKSMGNNLNIQELVDGEMVFSNYCADARLIKDYLEEADANIEWLQGMGVEFYPETINTTQHLYVGQGAAMIEKVNAYALGKGAQILTSTKAKKLFMENGEAHGLLCEGEKAVLSSRRKLLYLPAAAISKTTT